ncbi:MAG: 6-phosphogluconolactonase [Pseudomonadota bacterium]
MPTELDLITFPSREAAADRLADVILAHLQAGLRVKERVNLAVSGGATPKLLHERLSERDCPWANVDITLADERWVPPGETGSNETFAQETLVKGKAADAHFAGLWSDARSLEEGAELASKSYDALGNGPDVVLLGMGPDGHTASWFPYAEGLDKALAPSAPAVVAVRAKRSAVTGELTERLTLSLARVASAKLIILLMHGDEKRETFAAAKANDSTEEMPVRALFRERPDLWAAWAP